ncbi:MAG: hypothetical protein M1812_001784 [Candelaria pacifica]|nr:MAG: hypothetical protein M1812_001784 [Candelaria pacifica]
MEDYGGQKRKGSNASFSQMAANLRKSSFSFGNHNNNNNNTNNNNQSHPSTTTRKGSNTTSSSNFHHGSFSFANINENTDPDSDSRSRSLRTARNNTHNRRKASNISTTQIADNFRKQGFTSPLVSPNTSHSHSIPISPTTAAIPSALAITKQTNITVSERVRDGGFGGCEMGEGGRGDGGREGYDRGEGVGERRESCGRELRAVRSFRERVEGWRGGGV